MALNPAEVPPFLNLSLPELHTRNLQQFHHLELAALLHPVPGANPHLAWLYLGGLKEQAPSRATGSGPGKEGKRVKRTSGAKQLCALRLAPRPALGHLSRPDGPCRSRGPPGRLGERGRRVLAGPAGRGRARLPSRRPSPAAPPAPLPVHICCSWACNLKPSQRGAGPGWGEGGWEGRGSRRGRQSAPGSAAGADREAERERRAGRTEGSPAGARRLGQRPGARGEPGGFGPGPGGQPDVHAELRVRGSLGFCAAVWIGTPGRRAGRKGDVKMSLFDEPAMHTLQIGTNGERSRTPSPSNSPRLHNESCSIAPLTPSQSPRNEIQTQRPTPFSVVVAIDFGTTSSGYAFSFANDPEAIHMMRKWEGGDPGVANQKTPTSLLLTPEGAFHSFGYTARDYYHDLDPEEARDWLYFEKFKMKIHSTSDLTMKTELEAVNGKKVQAWEVFAHALRFFKRQAMQELKDQCPALPEKDAIRWVITVPAIWKQPAKQFMREAAYLAGLVPSETPEQLLIALEPEAASIYCRKLRLNQLIDLSYKPQANGLSPDLPIDSSFRQAREQLRRSRHSRTFLVESGVGELWAEMQAGDRYIVADCGGGTVDLTVHQIEQPQGTLKELYKASGGPYGAVGVDLAFEKLLCQIFGEDFIATFKAKRPAAWVDLTIAFEARKRTAAPHRANPLNISLPFSFIDFYRKHRGQNVETALKRSSVNLVKWSSQGMLRMSSEAMNELFQPTISQIINHIDDLMKKPEVEGIKFLFLVGGFAESAMLQHAVQSTFSGVCRVIIPQDVGLTILKGAVLFGLDPTIVRVRRSPLTYGVGVLNKFVEGKHPREKLLVKEGKKWCTDIFEKFVSVDQSVALGEVVQRSYCPARAGQRKIIINIYCCATDDVVYITDPGVRKCGTISLDLEEVDESSSPKRSRREIRASMQFGDTEIKVTAMDVRTSKTVRASIDFLSN